MPHQVSPSRISRAGAQAQARPYDHPQRCLLRYAVLFHALREKLPENGHCCHEAARSPSLGSEEREESIPKTLGIVFFSWGISSQTKKSPSLKAYALF